MTVISPEMFLACMHNAKWPKKLYRRMEKQSYCALLYYSGCRTGEVTRAVKKQFKVIGDVLYFDVGPRLKKGRHTPPLPLNLALPYMDTVIKRVFSKRVKPGMRVWPWSEVTGYNICYRVFNTYPHHLRLSRITSLLASGFGISQVMTWTGHKSLQTLNAYIGLVNIKKIGESLK
ncbi:site-specific integrase [Candidatus Pacearchaeota archaeon]|nr:site-specific integrase [Candidatus Pacearchaeota archaeon]